MNRSTGVTATLGKVAFLALIGFLAVVLAGPLVTLLAFALIGFLVWSVAVGVCCGRKAAWEGVCRAGKEAGDASAKAAQWAWYQGSPPVCEAGARAVNRVKGWWRAGREQVPEKLQAAGRCARQVAVQAGDALHAAGAKAGETVQRVGQAAGEHVRSAARSTGLVLLETVSGGLIGVALGFAFGSQTPQPEMVTGIGAGVGAVIGFIVGVSAVRRQQHAPTSETAV